MRKHFLCPLKSLETVTNQKQWAPMAPRLWSLHIISHWKESEPLGWMAELDFGAENEQDEHGVTCFYLKASYRELIGCVKGSQGLALAKHGIIWNTKKYMHLYKTVLFFFKCSNPWEHNVLKIDSLVIIGECWGTTFFWKMITTGKKALRKPITGAAVWKMDFGVGWGLGRVAVGERSGGIAGRSGNGDVRGLLHPLFSRVIVFIDLLNQS